MKIEFIKPFRFIGNCPDDGSDDTVPVGHVVDLENDESTKWLIDNGFAKEVQESGWWKPQSNEKYYSVDSCGEACAQSWLNDELDEHLYSVGNVFKTKNAAERYCDYLKAIATVRQDEGVLTPDDVRKTLARDGTVYTIGINCTMLSVDHAYNTSAGAVYFDTGYNAKASCDKHPDEWKIIANYDWSRE